MWTVVAILGGVAYGLEKLRAGKSRQRIRE
jgi:hypothetical protein